MVAVKTSYDNVAKSEEDKRSYRALQLNNGIKVGTRTRMQIDSYYIKRENLPFRAHFWKQLSIIIQVLLVSDETTDKSAAALDVHIGHMSDPVNLPGLAHFCEHMLFLGTEKFPDENEYSKFLSQHGGSFNAFTSSDHTN